MSLGLFVFSLPTLAYQELSRRTSWRHGKASRVGARPASQFLGQGEEPIRFTGLIAPEVTGDPASLQTLRDMGDQGDAYPLVAGSGEVLGAFVITDLDVKSTLFFGDGTPRQIEFELSLDRVDDDDAQAAATS